MSIRPVYLDYAATTPADPRVVEAMLPYFTECFGNAHAGHHAYGVTAQEALEQARAQVAQLIGGEAQEMIFTSGATESNNLALRGLAGFEREEGQGRKHIIISAVEHSSVFGSARGLEKEGYRLTVLPVQENGRVDPETLRAALTPESFLVSVMAANNEIGTVQPMAEIGAICREAGVWYHCDAAQAYGKIPLDVQAMKIDLLSISGHKIYGPQGIGALYLRRRPRVRLLPMLHGGNQERGLRAGTVALPLAVGLGRAAQIAGAEMAGEATRQRGLREEFLRIVQEAYPQILPHGDQHHCLPGLLSLRMPATLADGFLPEIFRRLALSTSAACHSARAEPSHVLQALGLEGDAARMALRISFGRTTTAAEACEAARILVETLGAFLGSGQDGKNPLEHSA